MNILNLRYSFLMVVECNVTWMGLILLDICFQFFSDILLYTPDQ